MLGDKANDAVFDNSKIKSVVPDYEAIISFEKGAEEIVEWYSDSQNQIINCDIDNFMDKIISEYSSVKS